MALISDETILEVKRGVDIVEVVQSSFPLRRSGANYKALCPFHEEKTPSFFVNPEKQIFICFGCGKKGDVIRFIMEHDRADYPEAIKLLADRAGIRVKYREGGEEGGVDRRELFRVNEWAEGVFRGLLLKAPEAATARAFLARRGVSDESSELFGLGYSMDAWGHLLGRARSAGIGEKLLEAAGLAISKEGRSGRYDRFRNRVMFPIGDARGKTIAFGARTLQQDQVKFLNSPETAIFAKGRGFYGLRHAREEWERTRTAYIVEGYLDVVIPHQAGVRGLVATLGTALTKDHLKVLRRYVDKVVLVFDADAAGKRAAERGLDLLLEENVDIFVAELPEGMDPDDVVLKEGPDRLQERLAKPREIFDFLMERLAARHGTETPAAKARIIGEMMERIVRIPDAVKQELLVQQLAAKFGIEERTLRAKLERPKAPETRGPAAAPRRADPAAVGAARELLACAAADAECAGRLRAEVPPEAYPSEALRTVAARAYELFDARGEVNGRDLVALMREPGPMEEAAEVMAVEIDPGSAAARFPAALEVLGRIRYREESRDRRSRLKNASPGEQDDLLRQALDARRKRPRDHGLLPGR